VEPGDREQDREQREDREAEVVHPHPAEDVAEPAEADDEHGDWLIVTISTPSVVFDSATHL